MEIAGIKGNLIKRGKLLFYALLGRLFTSGKVIEAGMAFAWGVWLLPGRRLWRVGCGAGLDVAQQLPGNNQKGDTAAQMAVLDTYLGGAEASAHS